MNKTEIVAAASYYKAMGLAGDREPLDMLFDAVHDFFPKAAPLLKGKKYAALVTSLRELAPEFDTFIYKNDDEALKQVRRILREGRRGRATVADTALILKWVSLEIPKKAATLFKEFPFAAPTETPEPVPPPIHAESTTDLKDIEEEKSPSPDEVGPSSLAETPRQESRGDDAKKERLRKLLLIILVCLLVALLVGSAIWFATTSQPAADSAPRNVPPVSNSTVAATFPSTLPSAAPVKAMLGNADRTGSDKPERNSLSRANANETPAPSLAARWTVGWMYLAGRLPGDPWYKPRLQIPQYSSAESLVGNIFKLDTETVPNGEPVWPSRPDRTTGKYPAKAIGWLTRLDQVKILEVDTGWKCPDSGYNDGEHYPCVWARVEPVR